MAGQSCEATLAFFKAIPLFSHLDQVTLEKIIESAAVIDYQPAQLILKEGEFADAFYIVMQGDVRIFTFSSEKKIVLGRFQKGECFGEQAFSSAISPRRTASAEAISHTTLYRIPRQALDSFADSHTGLTDILRRSLKEYIQDKLAKLTQSFGVYLNLTEILKTTRTYEKNEILYYQDEPAQEVFILNYGSVELRYLDQEMNIVSRTELGVGEIFGAIPLEENLQNYPYTVVAKTNAQVIVIPVQVLHESIRDISNFSGVIQKLAHRQKFSQYGPTLQFRGQHKEMPTFATLIMLKDGREVICQQIVRDSLIYISVANTTPDQTLEYTQVNYKRELQLKNQCLIGLCEVGQWEDTDHLLELIVKQYQLSEADFAHFKTTGLIDTSIHTSKDHTFVCQCMRVTRAEIDAVIKAGHCTVEAIRNKTGASSVCGACHPTIIELLGGQAWTPCQLSVNKAHNEYIQSFKLTPLAEASTEFIPGQHLVIRSNINNLWISRSYTLTTSPQHPYFEVTVKLEEKGLFSPWLFENASKNPLIYASGPYGDFTLRKESPSLICFAGGIGITPFLAFCRYLIKHQPEQKLYIDYSARYQTDIVCREELEESVRLLKNAQVVFRETSTQGKITEQDIIHLLGQTLDHDIYICGPESFENYVTEVLRKAGMPPAQIHVERFIQAGAPENSPQTISF